jgi:hypothetical protein
MVPKDFGFDARNVPLLTVGVLVATGRNSRLWRENSPAANDCSSTKNRRFQGSNRSEWRRQEPRDMRRRPAD